MDEKGISEWSNIHVTIGWDTEADGETPSAESLGLPEKFDIPVGLSKDAAWKLLNMLDHDQIVDALSDRYGYCITQFTMEVFPLGKEK